MFIKSQKSMDSYYVIDGMYANGVHIYVTTIGDNSFNAKFDLVQFSYSVAITMKYTDDKRMAKYSSREKAEKVSSMFLNWLDSTRVYEEHFQFPEDEEVIVEEE